MQYFISFVFFFFAASSLVEASWPAVYKKNLPSVVKVQCGLHQGAGTVALRNNLIITSAFLAGCGRKIWIRPAPLQPLQEAFILQTDFAKDIAWIQTEKPIVGAQVMPLKESHLFIAEEIGIIGHPYQNRGSYRKRAKQFMGWSFLKGNVSQVGKELFQVHFTLLGGCLGSPIFNTKGEMIGMIVNKTGYGLNMAMALSSQALLHSWNHKKHKEDLPYFTYDVQVHARFSFPWDSSKKISVPPSSQEVLFELTFADQWVVGFTLGVDLLSFDENYNLSILLATQLDYKILAPEFARPWLDYISIGVGVMASQINLRKQLPSSVLDLGNAIQFQQAYNVYFGLKIYSMFGQFSVGTYLDFANLNNPVFSVSWGFYTQQ